MISASVKPVTETARHVRKTAHGGAVRVLARFPNLGDATPSPPRAPRASDPKPPQRPDPARPKRRTAGPRIGWRSIVVLTVLAIASCTAAWWKERGSAVGSIPGQDQLRIAEKDALNNEPTTLR